MYRIGFCLSVFLVRIRIPDPFPGGAVRVKHFWVFVQICLGKPKFYCQTNTLYTILSENCEFLSVLCGSANIFRAVLHLKICRQHSSWTPFHHTLALPYGCFRTISTSFKMFLPYIGSSFFLLWCPQHKCNDMLFHLTRKILFGTFHDSSKSQPCSPTIFEQAYCTRSYIFGVFALPQLNLEPFG